MRSPRLEEILRPFCSVCEKQLVVVCSNKTKFGFLIYSKYCQSCYNKKYKGKWPHKRRESKKSFCELCGFVAADPCQLDVDHFDGNSKNNQPNNWQTLCSNCHRLKTKQQKDGFYRTHKKEIEQTPTLS